MKEARRHNRRLAKMRVQWLIEYSPSLRLLFGIDSFVLRNPILRQAPKRCGELAPLIRHNGLRLRTTCGFTQALRWANAKPRAVTGKANILIVQGLNTRQDGRIK